MHARLSNVIIHVNGGGTASSKQFQFTHDHELLGSTHPFTAQQTSPQAQRLSGKATPYMREHHLQEGGHEGAPGKVMRNSQGQSQGSARGSVVRGAHEGEPGGQS